VPGDLQATNTPTDGQVPSYDDPTKLFEWITAGAGAAQTVLENVLVWDAQSTGDESWQDIIGYETPPYGGTQHPVSITFTLPAPKLVRIELAISCLLSPPNYQQRVQVFTRVLIDGNTVPIGTGFPRGGGGMFRPYYDTSTNVVYRNAAVGRSPLPLMEYAYVSCTGVLYVTLAAGEHTIKAQWAPQVEPDAGTGIIYCRPKLSFDGYPPSSVYHNCESCRLYVSYF